jgi:hypothetical protein
VRPRARQARGQQGGGALAHQGGSGCQVGGVGWRVRSGLQGAAQARSWVLQSSTRPTTPGVGSSSLRAPDGHHGSAAPQHRSTSRLAHAGGRAPPNPLAPPLPREEGADILILARTDARQAVSLDEALWRAHAFAEAGADIVFIDALESVEEMQALCALGGAARSAPGRVEHCWMDAVQLAPPAPPADLQGHAGAPVGRPRAAPRSSPPPPPRPPPQGRAQDGQHAGGRRQDAHPGAAAAPGDGLQAGRLPAVAAGGIRQVGTWPGRGAGGGGGRQGCSYAGRLPQGAGGGGSILPPVGQCWALRSPQLMASCLCRLKWMVKCTGMCTPVACSSTSSSLRSLCTAASWLMPCTRPALPPIAGRCHLPYERPLPPPALADPHPTPLPSAAGPWRRRWRASRAAWCPRPSRWELLLSCRRPWASRNTLSRRPGAWVGG